MANVNAIAKRNTIVSIAGSPSHPSRSLAVLEYAKTFLASEGLQLDLSLFCHSPVFRIMSSFLQTRYVKRCGV